MPSEWTLSISGFSPFGKLLRIYIPVAQARVIVLALPEPAIVHDEAFHADGRSLLRKSLLSVFVHIEAGRLPRVVDHRTHFGGWGLRQNARQLKAVQQPRCLADTRV